MDTPSFDTYIKTTDLLLHNKKNDALMQDTLSETTYKTIEGLNKEFGDIIKCEDVDKYKSWTINLHNINNINRLQNNYKSNISLIMFSRKNKKDSLYSRVKEEEKQGDFNISRKIFTLLLKECRNYNEILDIFSEYGEQITEYDNVIYNTVFKILTEKNEINEFITNFCSPKLFDTKSLNLLLGKQIDLEGSKKILDDYGNDDNINIDSINFILKYINNSNSQIKFLNKYNLKPNIDTINILLLKLNDETEINDLFNKYITNENGLNINLGTISLLLHKIEKIDDIIEYKDIIDFSNINKKKFISNYYLYKVSYKFNISIEGLYDKLNDILVKGIENNITENNWMTFI